MNRAIYSIIQEVLQSKQVRQLLLPSSENQQVSLVKITLSSESISSPSSIMRMCCCSMSC